MRIPLRTITLALAPTLAVAARPAPELAPTPPMGWNGWNWHGKKDINETVVIETIDATVTSGLRDAGYNCVVVDGGCATLSNDPRVMTPAKKDFVRNREAIAINQDPTEQGRRSKQAIGTEVWVKKLRGNRQAVLLLNCDTTTSKPITFQLSDGGPTGNGPCATCSASRTSAFSSRPSQNRRRLTVAGPCLFPAMKNPDRRIPNRDSDAVATWTCDLANGPRAARR